MDGDSQIYAGSQFTDVMRPTGIIDMEISSFMKKFKDKRFATKYDRDFIKKDFAMLGMDVNDVAVIYIDGICYRTWFRR